MARGQAPGNASAFIAQALNEGLSRTGAVGAFQAAAKAGEFGGVRRQTLFRIAGEIEAALKRSPGVMGMDPALMPSDDQISDRTGGRDGLYSYNVAVQVRDLESGEISTRWHSTLTSSVISLGTAIDEAMDAMSDPNDAYGEVVVGGVVTSVSRYTGPA